MASVVANANRTSKSDKEFKPGDFCPKQDGEEPDEQTPEDAEAQFRTLLGAVIKNG